MFFLLYLLPGTLAVTNSTQLTTLAPDTSLASIYSSDYTRGYRFEGAGVVISSEYVLTIATVCSFYDKGDVSVRVGSITRPADGSTAKGYIYLKDLEVHSDYDESTQDYDYCLLHLNQTVSAKPAFLPLLPIVEYQQGNLVGWGETMLDGNTVLTARRGLVKVERSCADQWEDVREITPRMNCGTFSPGSTASACSYDEGSLVYDDYGTTILGLSSFGSWSVPNNEDGYECTTRPRANVNSDVFEARLWILENSKIIL